MINIAFNSLSSLSPPWYYRHLKALLQLLHLVKKSRRHIIDQAHITNTLTELEIGHIVARFGEGPG